jgi:hypothetical protein
MALGWVWWKVMRCKWRFYSSKPYWFRTIPEYGRIQFWDLPLLRDHRAKF